MKKVEVVCFGFEPWATGNERKKTQMKPLSKGGPSSLVE